jgi:F-type H+-transporting ATPase subunit c
MKRTWSVIALVLILGAMAGPLLAAAEEPPVRVVPTLKDAGAANVEPPAAAHWSKSISVVGACIGAAIAAAGGGYGVGRIGSACIESIARQPEAARDMFAPMVVAAGMVEVGMLFAIVVCLLGILM